MIYTNDPHKDFLAYEEERENRLKELPTCNLCGEHIQDDGYWEINGEVLCDDCVRDTYWRWIE